MARMTTYQIGSRAKINQIRAKIQPDNQNRSLIEPANSKTRRHLDPCDNLK